jgi:very-short-patch-repair endonuclease
MRPQLDTDRRIASIASRQHGLIRRDQLLRLGLSERAIARRLSSGRLIAVHRGVYAVGHAALSQRGRWLATVWACGSTAVLSHGSALALWELTPNQPSRFHVTVRSYAGRSTPTGIQLHRSTALTDADVTVRHGIPITRVVRSLLDAAPSMPQRQLNRAMAQADVLRLLDFAEVDRVLAAYPRRAGAPKLRMAAAEHRPGGDMSRTDFEDRLVELLVGAGLPTPRINAWIAGLEVDVSWPEVLVVAEADSRMFHNTWAAKERDAERDTTLTAAGCIVHRFTDRQLRRTPEAVIAAVRRSLSDRGRIAS